MIGSDFIVTHHSGETWVVVFDTREDRSHAVDGRARYIRRWGTGWFVASSWTSPRLPSYQVFTIFDEAVNAAKEALLTQDAVARLGGFT